MRLLPLPSSVASVDEAWASVDGISDLLVVSVTHIKNENISICVKKKDERKDKSPAVTAASASWARISSTILGSSASWPSEVIIRRLGWPNTFLC